MHSPKLCEWRYCVCALVACMYLWVYLQVLSGICFSSTPRAWRLVAWERRVTNATLHHVKSYTHARISSITQTLTILSPRRKAQTELGIFTCRTLGVRTSSPCFYHCLCLCARCIACLSGPRPHTPARVQDDNRRQEVHRRRRFIHLLRVQTQVSAWAAMVAM